MTANMALLRANGAWQMWWPSVKGFQHHQIREEQLDSCKALDSVLQDILVSQLEKHQFHQCFIQLILIPPGGNQRVLVNSSLSKRPVTTGVPLASVLGLLLCDIFVGDMDSWIECTLNQFAHTRLCGTVNTREGMPSIRTWTGLRGGPVQTY